MQTYNDVVASMYHTAGKFVKRKVWQFNSYQGRIQGSLLGPRDRPPEIYIREAKRMMYSVVKYTKMYYF